MLNQLKVYYLPLNIIWFIEDMVKVFSMNGDKVKGHEFKSQLLQCNIIIIKGLKCPFLGLR